MQLNRSRFRQLHTTRPYSQVDSALCRSEAPIGVGYTKNVLNFLALFGETQLVRADRKSQRVGMKEHAPKAILVRATV